MSFIAKLKLVASKRERNLSPIMMRRQKLATKIEEQIELARCQKNGTLYAPQRLKNITNEPCEKKSNPNIRQACLPGRTAGLPLFASFEPRRTIRRGNRKNHDFIDDHGCE